MRVIAFASLILLPGCSAVAAFAQQQGTSSVAAAPQLQGGAENVDKSTIVYVNDFELEVPVGAAEKPGATVNTALAATVASSVQSDGKAQSDTNKGDSPAEQAARIVDFMS